MAQLIRSLLVSTVISLPMLGTIINRITLPASLILLTVLFIGLGTLLLVAKKPD